MKNKNEKQRKSKPISLYPLEPEEALKDMFEIPHKVKKKKKIEKSEKKSS